MFWYPRQEQCEWCEIRTKWPRITPDISECDSLAARSTWCLAKSGLQLQMQMCWRTASPGKGAGSCQWDKTVTLYSPGSASVKVLGKVHRAGDPKPVFACIMITCTQLLCGHLLWLETTTHCCIMEWNDVIGEYLGQWGCNHYMSKCSTISNWAKYNCLPRPAFERARRFWELLSFLYRSLLLKCAEMKIPVTTILSTFSQEVRTASVNATTPCSMQSLTGLTHSIQSL